MYASGESKHNNNTSSADADEAGERTDDTERNADEQH